MHSSNSKQKIAVQKFRPLKKEMQILFRKIKWALQDEKLPSKDMLDEFLRQAEIMTSYQGFGDTAYQPFVSACRKLCALEKTGDVHTMHEQLQLIANLRQQCHENFRDPL